MTATTIATAPTVTKTKQRPAAGSRPVPGPVLCPKRAEAGFPTSVQQVTLAQTPALLGSSPVHLTHTADDHQADRELSWSELDEWVRERQEEQLLEEALPAATRQAVQSLRRQGVKVRVRKQATGMGLEVLPDAHRYIGEDGRNYIGFSVR